MLPRVQRGRRRVATARWAQAAQPNQTGARAVAETERGGKARAARVARAWRAGTRPGRRASVRTASVVDSVVRGATTQLPTTFYRGSRARPRGDGGPSLSTPKRPSPTPTRRTTCASRTTTTHRGCDRPRPAKPDEPALSAAGVLGVRRPRPRGRSRRSAARHTRRLSRRTRTPPGGCGTAPAAAHGLARLCVSWTQGPHARAPR